MNFGILELSIILIIILILFGAKRIPELFKSISKGVKEFKESQNDKKED